MKIFIAGICGFVGSVIARTLLEIDPTIEITGADNLIRRGSEFKRVELKKRGIKVFHADLRNWSDFQAIPCSDYVIDAAANPSVLAGVDGQTSSRQLLEHNLGGTINLLEFCKASKAGFILLSTSRVYAIETLTQIPLKIINKTFVPDGTQELPHGVTLQGISELFSVAPPLSLYGSSKLASELLALEYGSTFDFPIWINRCGVLAGAGQFGRPDQGIFAYWINSYLRKKPLQYKGFGGTGAQVRDVFHPADLAPLILRQMKTLTQSNTCRTINLGGGSDQSMSLAQLTDWCEARFGVHEISSDPTPRPFDIPWMVLDCERARKQWGWKPAVLLPDILEEIAVHAEQHPEWLEMTS